MRLSGRTAIITGAGSGMGRASAIMFAKEGAKVVVADLSPQQGQETVDIIRTNGGEAVYVQVDVSNEKDVIEMINKALESFKQLNIIFNVAGCPQTAKPIDTISDEEWERIMAVNVKSIFLGAKYALPELKKAGNGVILNVASVGALRPRPGSVCYSASKGAVISITKALAIELAPFNIRVNCINPGPTDTPMMYKFVPGYNEKIKEEITKSMPLGHFVMPEDIAFAAVYLASDEARLVTGTWLNIDSGLYIGRGEL